MVQFPAPAIRRCTSCQWLFVSSDPDLVRRCRRCKSEEEEAYEPPRGNLYTEEAVPEVVDSW
jgi:predicted Zn-ribbon and HTH transcriptional regulator